VYDDAKSLRYGHLMIMTDQDHDGSHIKGLIMNFLHTFYPSLLKLPGFLLEFITPIVKVRGIWFCSLPSCGICLPYLAQTLKRWMTVPSARLPTTQATKKKQRVVFYTMPEYEAWKESLGGNTSGWNIKYYKVFLSLDLNLRWS